MTRFKSASLHLKSVTLALVAGRLLVIAASAANAAEGIGGPGGLGGAIGSPSVVNLPTPSTGATQNTVEGVSEAMQKQEQALQDKKLPRGASGKRESKLGGDEETTKRKRESKLGNFES